MIELEEETIRQWSLSLSDNLSAKFKANFNFKDFDSEEVIYSEFLEKFSANYWTTLCEDIETKQNIIIPIAYDSIIGATNRADLLDSALLRPGRIDKRVYIGNPDLKTREAILNIHLKGKPRSGKVDVDNLKELTNGLSGAQIENLLNEAMLLALRNDREIMVMEDIESILSRILVGYQSSENSYSTNMIKRIAIHEMGHAIVGILSLDHAKLVKVCLNVWSPSSPGYTIFENAEVDSNIYTKEKLLSRLMVLLSGRIAEEVFFGESITSGASKDIEEAYKLAEQMIVKFGMGSKIVYPQHSEDSKNYIDKDIEKLIESTYQEAYTIIMNCKNIIEECSNELIKNQILIPEKIYDIMKKYNINT